jgi:hypothetical protein
LVEKLRAKPAAGRPAFEAIARKLARSESSLESADAAPTQSQQTVVADALAMLDTAKTDWATMKAGPLAALNASLARAGQKPVEISAAALREVEEPDEGEDLP